MRSSRCLCRRPSQERVPSGTGGGLCYRRVAEFKTKPWGQTKAYVQAPDGVFVKIGSEMWA